MLEDGLKSAGKYQTALHGNNLSSGVYIVLWKIDIISQTIKLILVK
jgi:hypothetical protein